MSNRIDKNDNRMEAVQAKILNFFKKHKGKKDLTYQTDLFKGGYVNSLFAIQMVLFLEKEFSIQIPKKEISEKNFKTIEKMAELVIRLKEV